MLAAPQAASLGAFVVGAMALAWFTQMRKCGVDVRELMHDGCPVACVDDAPVPQMNPSGHSLVPVMRPSSPNTHAYCVR